MKLFILIFFSILSGISHAGFILSPGGGFTGGFETQEKNASGDPLVKMDGAVGVLLEGELPLLANFFSIYTSAFFIEQEGLSQYVNTANATFKDLKTKSTTSLGMLGVRIRPINFKRFKIYLGGGAATGIYRLAYDKEDFVSKGGAVNTFKDNERSSTWGPYLDLGTEFIIEKNSAVRAGLRLIDTQTMKYKTLGSKKFSADYGMFTLAYMHYFDWKFRRSSK